MRSQVKFLCSAVAALAIAGCASTEPKQAFDPQLAKTVDMAASEAAVAKPGTKVCRWLQLGIAERDLIRGVVLQTEGSNIRVRIEDAGRFPNSLNGQRIARGEVIRDAATAWSPCISRADGRRAKDSRVLPGDSRDWSRYNAFAEKEEVHA